MQKQLEQYFGCKVKIAEYKNKCLWQNRNAEKGLQKCIGEQPPPSRCQHLNKMLQF